LLLLGYLHYAPGAVYSLSAQHYRTWSFPAFRYSDLIWLYLRDGLDRRPLPYVDYLLEYPPLTGLVSWLLSWAPDLPTYFTLAYSLLAACSFLTIWALQQIGGANVWLFAASPALFFYTGHQWDMAAIGVGALALLALQRDRTGWGVAGLVIATSLKLFPVVFVAAAVVERIRDRRFRSAATMSAAFAAGTLAINVPVAFASVEGWSFFFRWNRDRLADSGIWVLWRGVPTQDLTRWSLVAVLVGDSPSQRFAFRSRGPVTIPVGCHLSAVVASCQQDVHHASHALGVSQHRAVECTLVAVGIDERGRSSRLSVGNYLNLYNVPDYQSAPLIRKAVENIYDPVQIARSAVLLVTALWGAHVLRGDALRTRYAKPIGVSLLRPETKRLEVAAVNEEPRRLTRRGFLGIGAVALAFTAATVLMTWPYAENLSNATVVGFDPFLQIWLSEWIQHALTTNPLALYDANIFYPFAQTLAYTDANVPGALLAAPLRFLTGDPLLTNSLMVLATFVVAAAGVYAVTLYLTGNHGAAFIAGLAYAFLPYRMVHLWHLNWLEGAFMPWMILALVRLIDRPSTGRSVVLGLLTAMLVLISFYFSVQIALVLAALAIASSLASRHRPSLELWRSLAVATAVILTIATPLYVPYLQVREEQRLERTIVDAEQYKALPASYLQLAPWDTPKPRTTPLWGTRRSQRSLTEVGQAAHADGHQHGEIVIEDALYPAPSLQHCANRPRGWRSRRWLAMALAVTGLTALILSSDLVSDLVTVMECSCRMVGCLIMSRSSGPARAGEARRAGESDSGAPRRTGMAVVWIVCAKIFGCSDFEPAWAGPALTVVLAVAVLGEFWTEPSRSNRSIAEPPPVPRRGGWLCSRQVRSWSSQLKASSLTPAAASVRRHYGETMFWSTLHWKP
jgi:hypothetical protein